MKVAIIYGTRPEVIKVAPVIHALKSSLLCVPFIISTGQHRDMVRPLLEWFGFKPDIDLDLMKPGQTPQEILAASITELDGIFKSSPPDVVLVQGDTSTALAGAIAAFHNKIPVGHIEAGLRTGHFYSPFPEEMNRSLIGRIATYNFAPTERAKTSLRKENVPGSIYMVGNTIVDAMLWTARRLAVDQKDDSRQVLITAHRRESFGAPLHESLSAIGELATEYPDFEFIYPVHRNPNVSDVASLILGNIHNIKLINPVDYPEMIRLLRSSCLIISDSGGLQEEAPTFGIPILVMRESTERPEIIDAGVGTLVGTSREKILKMGRFYLSDASARSEISEIVNPYGDGTTADKIVGILVSKISERREAQYV
jgi:UDP-N-acetylglucosamine 2-epimerase (non-hydrolysing)